VDTSGQIHQGIKEMTPLDHCFFLFLAWLGFSAWA
jgi:hypothetical protein